MDREGQTTTTRTPLVEQLGRVGLWTRQLDIQPTDQLQSTIAELEELGWRSLWAWEVFGREALTNAGLLLCATQRLVIGTGIANIWARDPVAMAAAQRTLTEAYPGRFVLGIYAIVLIVLAATYAGTTWGLGRTWARLPFVNRNRWAL